MSTATASSPPIPKGPLAGRVVLVTGGTRGIGAAISHRLAAEGAQVAAGYWRHAEPAEKFLATVRKGQEIALDAIRTMVDTIQTITPKVPSVDLPFADKLPKPQDVVASGYDFAEKLLSSQRKFADEVVKAAAPLLPGNSDSDSK